MPERAARLIHEQKMGPAIIVFPDCFTALGGNQYVNSSAIGNYADYLTREIVPFVDREFRTLASREHRGCFGKSSGGYGAIIHGMKYAKYWGAIADHSGDAYFDFVYWHDWPNTLNELAKYRAPEAQARPLSTCARDERDRRCRGLRRRPRQALPRARVEEGEARRRRRPRVMNLCMAATYDPDPTAPLGFRAAVQPRDRRADRASAGGSWRAHDPINLVAAYQREPEVAARHLHRLRLARPVPHPLRRAHPVASGSRSTASAHLYEEFDDNHSDDRLPDGRQPAVPLSRAEALIVASAAARGTATNRG